MFTDIFAGARRKLNEKTLPNVLKKKFRPEGFNAAAMQNVSVFPKLNLAFNRVKKNGNSTTVSLLHAMEVGEIRSTHAAKRQSALLRTTNIPMMMQANDYFYFVIIRNPYSRTLSAFLNKLSKPYYRERFGSFPLTPDGFHQFLIWLSSTGLESDPHWDFQKKLILGALPDFDAVLRLEDFPNCLADLLRSRDLKLPKEANDILASVQRDTRTGASSRLEQFYSKDSIAIVKSLYKEDFDFLEYSANFLELSTEGACLQKI
ncbi:MAG: sulfotransferase family 2 domain-containing protein [Roseobacter sp.]